MNRKEYKRNWQINHREKFREYSKKWRINNLEKVREIRRKWDAQNPEKLKQYRKKYLEGHKEQIREYRKNNPVGHRRYKYHEYKCRAKSKQLSFNLTKDEFASIVSSPCFYCGVSGEKGVDRIDNSLGYTKENSVSSCKLCNFMKKAMSLDNFLLHIQKIYEFQRK